MNGSLAARPHSSSAGFADRRPVALGVLSGIVAITLLLLAVTESPLIACLPVLAASTGFLLLRLPVRLPLLALLAAVAFSDIVPQAMPPSVDGRYEGPAHLLYRFFFDNLNNLVGVAALRFSATEVILTVLIVIGVGRAAVGARIDRVGRLSPSTALTPVLVLAVTAVLAMEVSGIARGGDFRQSLWQSRQLFWLPVVAALFSYALRDQRDFEAALRLLTIAACIKIVFGIHYLATVAWPAQMKATMITSHNDSLLFVVVLMGVICRCVHAPSRRTLMTSILVGAWIVLGIVLNSRRIAFVSLFACLMMLFIVLRGPVKRAAARLMIRGLPLVVIYLVAGRNHPNGIFKPAAQIMSVTAQKDASSQTRDIENTNLIHTLRQHPALGAGWGHEYIELVKADDISQYFAQYRFIAHNSVLWLWSIGGVIGFTCVWLPLCTAIFFARRSYAFARSAAERTNAMLILSTVVTYMVQAWGDMGTQGLSCMMIAALAIAASASLAVETGAVPSRMRFTTWKRGPATVRTTLPGAAWRAEAGA